jgi:hypothetical protein
MSKTTEQKTKAAASGSANALNRAIQYLGAAMGELDQAHAYASASERQRGARGLDASGEKNLHAALSRLLLEAPGAGRSIIDLIRDLRDCRASRAGFSFDEEN